MQFPHKSNLVMEPLLPRGRQRDALSVLYEMRATKVQKIKEYAFHYVKAPTGLYLIMLLF